MALLLLGITQTWTAVPQSSESRRGGIWDMYGLWCSSAVLKGGLSSMFSFTQVLDSSSLFPLSKQVKLIARVISLSGVTQEHTHFFIFRMLIMSGVIHLHLCGLFGL